MNINGTAGSMSRRTEFKRREELLVIDEIGFQSGPELDRNFSSFRLVSNRNEDLNSCRKSSAQDFVLWRIAAACKLFLRRIS